MEDEINKESMRDELTKTIAEIQMKLLKENCELERLKQTNALKIEPIIATIRELESQRQQCILQIVKVSWKLILLFKSFNYSLVFAKFYNFLQARDTTKSSTTNSNSQLSIPKSLHTPVFEDDEVIKNTKLMFSNKTIEIVK